MSSASQYPPLAPPPPPAPIPPPYRHRRSIAGPLVLILIGVIFLLHNVGFRFPFWHWFGHWWPVLLILWGVIIMIENATAHRMGYRPRHLGAGGVVLLIVLVCLGVSAHFTTSDNYNWNGIRDQLQMDDDLGGLFGTAYTFDETQQQAFPAKGTLRVVCDHGALNITTSDDNMLKVVVHKKLYAENQNDANKYNEGTKPQITVNGDSVVLNANTDGAGDHGVQSDMDISLPADAALDIASKRGDVTVSSRKAAVKVSLQRGDVAVSEITGPVQADIEKGSIRATQITGDVDVSGHVDNVSIDEVTGAVRLNGDFYEDIQLSKIAKTVTFKTSRSDMEIAAVPGDISISSDEVRGNQLSGPSRVVTGSKNIHLEDISGDLEVQSSNGDVEVTTAGKQPSQKMDVTTQHGDVALTLAGKTPPEKVNVATRHGDVTLTLAPGAGFQLTATTRKGDISSDFDAVKIEQTNGTSRATGSSGNGVSKVLVSTDTGDIKINKG